MSRAKTIKEKPCFIYVDQEPLTSYRSILKKISSKDIKEKKEALQTILGSMVNDDHYPSDLMIQAIHNLTIVDDIEIKKLLFLFWEVIEKTNSNGKIKDEFILVCNYLRKDLDSPNEYIVGRTLRLLTKLTMPEILENLKSTVFDNLKHKHAYVRSNALMCVMSFIENFGVDVVPDNLNDQLREIILKDVDTVCRRNAYLVYSKISPMESLNLTQEILENNEISELGDLFALTIAENLRKLCKTFPQKTSMFIKMLMELSEHKSNSVLFEIGNILLEVSSSPNVVIVAVNILCNLLHVERDNNTLVIILKKLIGIKNRHKEILQENILTFANLINLNYAVELRKNAFELINDLISRSNITQVFDKFIDVFNQLNSIQENEKTIELKNKMLKCLLINIEKFPEIEKNYPFFLLDKNLHSISNNNNEKKEKKYFQIISIKKLFELYSNNNSENSSKILNEMLNKIIKSFEEIDDCDIMQNCIWILSYYSNDLEMLKKVFDLIMKNLGDLNFEYSSNENNDNNNEEKPKINEKKTITKTVVLPDGTYGTVTQIVNTKEINKNKENKYLRKFILESNYYFSANLVSALTGIIFKMKKLNFDKFKIYYYNTINIICSILKLNSDVIIKDEDNTNHIKTCLKILLSNDDSIIEEFNNEYKNLNNNNINENDNKNNEIQSEENNKIKIINPDEPLHFRHTKIYDPDNFDVDDEEENLNSTNSSISIKKPSKFIEVLTGTEDPLFIECEIEIFTFDLSLNFIIKNKTSNSFQNVTLNLFVPNEFSIIEKPPIFSIEPNENVSVHCTVKFSKTINAYIYGQINFNNYKGENTSINLSGLFIELLNTFPENISDIQFRKKWIEYSWEHNVMLVSRKKSFKSIIENLINNLKMTIVFPKNIDDINEDEPFMVANLYSKTKLGEDALINISVEKTKDKKIIGTCVLRSKAKEFMMSLGEKIKAISY